MNIGSERAEKNSVNIFDYMLRVRVSARARATSNMNRISLFSPIAIDSIQMYFVWFIAFCFIESDTWHFHFIAQLYKTDWIVASSFATKFGQYNGKKEEPKWSRLVEKIRRIFHIYIVCAVFHSIHPPSSERPTDYKRWIRLFIMTPELFVFFSRIAAVAISASR